MTRKQALARYLIDGNTLSIMTAYKHLGISNPSREVIRLIEKPFGIRCLRIENKGKTKYGSACHWFEYKLHETKHNKKQFRALKKFAYDC